MALYKEHKSKFGIMVSYWMIHNFRIDRDRKKVEISVIPYISKEAKEAGNSPIEADQIGIRVEDIQYPPDSEWKNIMHYTEYFSPEALSGKDIYTVMYNYLKANIEFFKDAEDI